jgi:hypothetical protein
MGKQSSHAVPPTVIEALDASLHDIAEGRLQDAQAVQEEARRLLAAHDAARASAPSLRRTQPARRSIS